MYSVGEARKRLPASYVEQLYHTFPSRYADAILQAAARPLAVSARVNAIKTAAAAIHCQCRQHGLKFKALPWYEDALLFPSSSDREVRALPAYGTGELYLQSLSSMVPPLILDPTPESRVLDLCAAPGSKTSQMAAMMASKTGRLPAGHGQITAIEPDAIRLQRLQHTLDLLGVGNTEVRQMDGTKVGRLGPSHFDCVLVDAPCSGEGRFRIADPQSYRHWKPSLVSKLAKLQCKLLRSGLDALKPGGALLYSTCTLNTAENEEVIAEVLSGREDISVCKTRLPGLKVHAGLTKLGHNRLPSVLKNTMRILPSDTMEGFFCAKLVRNR